MKRFLDLIPFITLVLLLTYIGTLANFMYKLYKMQTQLNDASKVIIKHEQRLNNQKEYILKLKRDK